jgi:hypothetical protein
MSNCILFVIGFLKSSIKLLAIELIFFRVITSFFIYLGDITGKFYLADIIGKLFALFFLIIIILLACRKLMFMGLKVKSPFTMDFLMLLLIKFELGFLFLYALMLISSLYYLIFGV